MSKLQTVSQELNLTGVDSRSPQVYLLDSRAWAIWLVALVMVALLTRNPFYHALLGAWILLSWPTSTQVHAQGFGLKTMLRLGIFATIFSTLLNALTVHIGTTILWEIPGDLPLLSGPVTLEAATYGASTGLILIVILLIFARFGAAIDYASLLRYLPASLFEMGLIVSISFTLIPNLRRSWHDIQQAQALRGHRIRGVQDFAALLVPLMVNSLEKALTLAEAMESRGYARRGANASTPKSRLLLTISLLGVLLLLVLNTFTGISRPVLLIGLLACGISLWLGLKQHTTPRTRFKQGHWTWRENLLLVAMVGMMLVFLLASPQAINFDPYPRLSWPAFNPWLGLATLGAILPALLEKHD